MINGNEFFEKYIYLLKIILQVKVLTKTTLLTK